MLQLRPYIAVIHSVAQHSGGVEVRRAKPSGRVS